MPKSREFKIFPAGGGYAVIRRVSLQQAEAMEAREVCRRDYDTSTGELLGYRVIGNEHRKMDSELRTTRTTPGISSTEMQMNVLRSRTYRLNEEQRLQLIKKGVMPEDAIERAKAKIRVYPFVGPATGDILRVWAR
jgi:hypothetical protein